MQTGESATTLRPVKLEFPIPAAVARLLALPMLAGGLWPAVAAGTEPAPAPVPPRKVPAAPLVVVIDSGMAADHEAFRGRLLPAAEVKDSLPPPLEAGAAETWAGWDFVENDAVPQDRTGHGTHVAALVAKALANSGDTAARLAMFRTGDQRHELPAVAGAAEAVTALRAAGWDVPLVVCAFDYRRNPADGDQLVRFEQAFRGLLASGVTCVCAAGNQGADIDSLPAEVRQYPAAFGGEALIAVAACTPDGQLLATSNRGTKSVLLAAPGFAVRSAAPAGGAAELSGSSQAAAQVAAALAAHAVASRQRKPAELRKWLLSRLQLHPSLVGRVASGSFLPVDPAR